MTALIILYNHASTFQFEYKHIWNLLTTYLNTCQISVSSVVILDSFWFTFLLVSSNSRACNAFNHNVTCKFSITSRSFRIRIFVVAMEFILVILTLAKRNAITQYKTIVDKVVRDGGGCFAFTVGVSMTSILPSVQAVRVPFVNFALINI
ncbi:hypothetical protein BDQ17DRAFT_1338301 [Cyathus striatus]|nr:hypothetical protein BDQ17DRAFT_1338301 [Cyathus striatus]